MGKTSYMRLKGSNNLRLRLLLSMLSSTPILVEDIRVDSTWPGLRPHEVSFLRLLEKVCDDCTVEINETGRTTSKFPIIHAITWIDEGMVKRIRGFSFSARVSVQFENTMIHVARGIFNRLLPDVHIFTDHKAGEQAGKSPGYGISLVAETTSGCCIFADTTVSYPRRENEDEFEDEKKELSPPGDIGEEIASALLGEIEQGGVVDSTHQGLLFLLCALCPQDVSKVCVGKLSPYGVEVLRHIRDFLGVKFVIKPDP
ncbi:hypothetical protein ACS0TY_028964 [Phlomoides rotata]